MSEWAPKRFWSEVNVTENSEGFSVALDARAVKTPAKRALVVPTRQIAKQIADEWEAQTDLVDPTTMPWTRSANAAIDKVALQRAEVEAHLAEYAGTDLLSYRADGPESLIERQRALWDPILEWANANFDVTLKTTVGVMPVDQDAGVLRRLGSEMGSMNAFQLTGFHDLVTLSGSYILALKTVSAKETVEELWSYARLDEDWQAEQWGVDEEAQEQAELKKSAFFHAADFFHAAR